MATAPAVSNIPVSEEKKIASPLDRFKGLGLVDRQGLEQLMKSLPDDQVRVFSKSIEFLREGEHNQLINLSKRFRAAREGIAEESGGGVHTPLDSVIDEKGKLLVYLPDHLESLDQLLIADLLRFSTYFQCNLERCKGNSIPIPSGNEPCERFLMGFIQELLSNQVMERISYDKKSPYLIGKNCARVKLIQLIVDQKNQPLKYFKIPDRYIGGTKEFEKPELFRNLKSYLKESDVSKVETLLDNLARATVKQKPSEAKKKIGDKLLLPASEFLHLFERKVRKTVGTGKAKKVSLEPIKPTKPSQLVTVATWERDMVRELWEAPWTDLHALIEEYNQTPGLQRTYPNLESRARSVMEKMWTSKQEVLRRTKVRMEASKKDGKPLYKILNETRDYLAKLGTIEEAVNERTFADYSPYLLLPNIKYRDDKGFEYTSINGMKIAGVLSKVFPQTANLLAKWDKLTTIDNVEDILNE
jgi:hypothetical protein